MVKSKVSCIATSLNNLMINFILYFKIANNEFKFLEDSGSEEIEKKKTIRALKVLHIKQSTFMSLHDNGRHQKVR